MVGAVVIRDRRHGRHGQHDLCAISERFAAGHLQCRTRGDDSQPGIDDAQNEIEFHAR